VSARGFTLVEILVATLILSVGVVAVASVPPKPCGPSASTQKRMPHSRY